MWQVLRQQWFERGVEIVAVAEDVGGPADAKPLVDWAGSTHPSLIDEGLILARAFNVLDVARTIWIDEEGLIVRPAESPSLNHRVLGDPGREAARRDYHAPPGKVSRVGGRGFISGDEDNPAWQELLVEMAAPRSATAAPPPGPGYTERLLDWFENGAASPFALSPEEVLQSSGDRSLAESEAAAHFEIGQHLWDIGDRAGTTEHWREAHRLHPDNLTYKRQAWTFAAGPMQGRSEEYEGSWLTEMQARRRRNGL